MHEIWIKLESFWGKAWVYSVFLHQIDTYPVQKKTPNISWIWVFKLCLRFYSANNWPRRLQLTIFNLFVLFILIFGNPCHLYPDSYTKLPSLIAVLNSLQAFICQQIQISKGHWHIVIRMHRWNETKWSNCLFLKIKKLSNYHATNNYFYFCVSFFDNIIFTWRIE